jgi:hypothetical protein
MRAPGARRILLVSMSATLRASTPPEEPAAEDRSQGETREKRFQCDACGGWFEGEPGGAGLLLWTRGDEVRYEEPPLCESCASEIAVGALVKWDTEEEEEG